MLRANERIPCIMHSWDILQSHSTPKPRFGAHREQASERARQREEREREVERKRDVGRERKGGRGACVYEYVCVTQHASRAPLSVCLPNNYNYDIAELHASHTLATVYSLLIRTASCSSIDMIRHEVIDVFRYTVSRYV